MNCHPDELVEVDIEFHNETNRMIWEHAPIGHRSALHAQVMEIRFFEDCVNEPRWRSAMRRVFGI